LSSCITKKVRVAAYCRVSKNIEEQKSSIKIQMEAYDRIIHENNDWEIVEIFADPGRTGTNMKRRPQFQKMMANARAGKIDMILVKSASRFARNTVDLLNTVRELNSMGVGVYFEKERINSLHIHSEMLLTVYAAFAQEESRNISENMKHGIRQRFEMGIPKWALVYGLACDGHDHWTINEEEADVVRSIFQMVLEGLGTEKIACHLNEKRVSGPNHVGKESPWYGTTVRNIVQNEKYVGDVCMQKYCSVNRMVNGEYRFHDSVRNNIIDQYYVENHHPAIVSRDVFEDANMVLCMRNVHRGAVQYPYYGRLRCPYCGNAMVRIPTGFGKASHSWICGGEGEGIYYHERTKCALYFVKEPYLSRSVRKIILNHDVPDLQMADAKRLKEVQEILRVRETIEFIDLKKLVRSISFPDWDTVEITWVWGEKSRGEYRVDRPSDYPDPTIRKINGRNMIGPFELTSCSLQQVMNSVETLPARVSRVQIILPKEAGNMESPFVGVDVISRYEKSVKHSKVLPCGHRSAEYYPIDRAKDTPKKSIIPTVCAADGLAVAAPDRIEEENTRSELDAYKKEIFKIYHEAKPVLRADGSTRDEKHLRVAAYARVSTLKEDQEESYETQVDYFQNYIENNPEWENVGVYTDKGKSGRGVENRSGLKIMLEDAKSGKIDIILIKSISRFFRNCYKAQETLQILGDCNVEVKFLEGNISSMDPNATMIIQLLTSIAENESWSISENVKWGYAKRAEQGIRRIGNNHVWGYDEIDGVLIPNENADAVRMAFELFAAGAGYKDIRKKYDELDVTTMRSHNAFTTENLRRMFRNEIYVGDRLLQKKPPADSNPNASKKYPKSYESIYVKNDHEAIVRREIWDAVQRKMNRRKEIANLGLRTVGEPHVLLGKVFCGKCGSFMKPDKRRYRGELRITWKCDRWIKHNKGKTSKSCKQSISDKLLLKEVDRVIGCDTDESECFGIETYNEIERVEVLDRRVRVIMRNS